MINTKWDAIIFDLDGTLVDTISDIANSLNIALKNNGLKMWTVYEYRFMVGNGVRKLIERAAPGADERIIELVMSDYNRVYAERCLEFAKVYEGMNEVIERFKNAGIHLFVVTNKPDGQAKKIVGHLFGQGVFEGIYGSCDDYKNKPDAALTLSLLEKSGAKPAGSLFVGDSDVDVYTAANAGMKSAGALWGFRGKEELLAAGAEFLVERPMQLLKL